MNHGVEDIKAAYLAEQKANRPLLSADDLPLNYEAITDEWLTLILCPGQTGSKVTGHSLDTADDGNSNRRRIFLEYNTPGQQQGLPRSVFCKASHNLANRISLGMSKALHSEVNFYNVVAPELDIETPTCYHANYNEAYNSIVVLGDLGSDTHFCSHDTDITLKHAQGQMRLLANFHGKFLQHPELSGRYSCFSTWTEFFGALDYPDFEAACDKGFEMAEEVIPERLFRRRNEIWPATRRSVQCHNDLPQTLNHGDCHLRNWYIAPAGTMGINDWQGMNRGHWSRDVAYTIATSLSVENRRRWMDELILDYHQHLEEAAGQSIPKDGILDELRRQLFTVLAYWTITINPAPGMPDMQPKDSTLAFIQRIATVIDDLEALDSF